MKKFLEKLLFFSKKYATLLGALAVFFIAFAFRNSIVERDLKALEQSTGCKFAPFLVESAVMYSYINSFAAGSSIGGVDPALPGMADRKVSEQMSLSLEYAGGYLLKAYRRIHGEPEPGIYEPSYAESRFLRKSFTWYLALAPMFIFLMLRWMRVPFWYAFAGAAIQIFSAAALGRYTGQDLLKGAFAWPLLTAYLACYAASLHGRYRTRQIALIGAMLTAAAAMASWDASQMLIGALALSDIIAAIVCRRSNRKYRNFYLATFIAMTLTALLVPYCQAHGSFFSPVIQWLLPAAILCHCRQEKHRRVWQIAGTAVLGLWSIGVMYFAPFAGNYNHFTDLLIAKLKFGNVLPADPALLTFDQRYLWTPELHSATWQTTKMIFPAALPLLVIIFAISILCAFFKRKSCPWNMHKVQLLSRNIQFAALTLTWFAVYIFFMRFRDMTMLFAALALPAGCYALYRLHRSKSVYYVLLALLLLSTAVEWRASRRIKRGYPAGLNYAAAMLKHVRQYDLSGKTVLTDMQTSSYLKGYTDAGILIQAKYELPEVRQLTQDYVNKFFNAPLDEFVLFCEVNKVDYILIHIPTITTPGNIPYSYRYISNTANLRKDSAAVQLGMLNQRQADFYEIALPPEVRNINGYRLYKFIPEEDIKRADRLTGRAIKAYQKGQRKKARAMIKKAYRMAPAGPESRIYQCYFRITGDLPPEITLPPVK